MNKIQDSSSKKWLQKDRRVWIKQSPSLPNPYQDAFLQGIIREIQQKHVLILLSDSKQQHKIAFSDCLKLTFGPKDVADMVDLQQLNQPQLLYNIKRRYLQDNIFTYCGPTLLIINPYGRIDRLFNDNVLHQYQAYVFTDTLQYKNISPHIFGLAAFCLWQLFDNERNQSIVISGESGAGKTENTKYCLKFLASLGKNMKELTSDSTKKSKIGHNLRAAERAVKKANSKVFGIQQKILGCNQILQAFGNSKTIRNDNSSRFGKLILLVYGQTQIQIKSAFIISYLLQKSRIVSLSPGQRNYHIFYYLLCGTSQQQKSMLHLSSSIASYHYLSQSQVHTIPNLNDQQKFTQLMKQFKLYLSDEQIDAVLKILAVVLNMGNVKFVKGENQSHQETVTIANIQYLEYVSHLLQVDLAKLQHCFLFKTRKMGLSVINSPLKYDQAVSLRDSFSKNIYQKIFNFLIKKLNQKIQIEQIDLQSSLSYRKSIGLLDIFGFEVLQTNSLQQFFINFANQKLQQLYVSYIFKQEQTQFMRQGLKEFSHDIGFQDNKPVIDLIEHYPLGIFHLVNEASQLNKDDMQLPQTILKNHSKNQFLKIPKAKRSCFEINHSCSPVTYTTSGFTSKNKDQFPGQLLSVIQSSTSAQMVKICMSQQKVQQKEVSKGGSKSSKKFLGSKFLAEMNKLIEELYSCDCHFVRCIKPNNKKEPKLFNSEGVLQSLRYLGVLDSIIIRKLGFIYRRPFKQFYKKFYQLDNYVFSYHADVKGKTQDDFKKQSQKIIQKYAKKELQDNNILFGHKKILIKESTLNHLELITKQKRRLRINSANRFKLMYQNAVFRAKVKVFLKYIKVLKLNMKSLASQVREKILLNKIVKIQNVVKKFLWQRRFQKIKQEATKSVTKISAYLKMKRQRKIYLETKRKSIILQATIRSYLTMGKFFRQRSCQKIVLGLFKKCWDVIQNKNALIIQKNYKGYLIRKTYKQAIQQMKKNIRISRVRSKFKRALFQHKYNLFKKALAQYKKPILTLQAIVRGKYHHRAYNKIRQSTLKIQKAYRMHLKKKFYLQKYWRQYRRIMSQNQCLKVKEMKKLKINIQNTQKIDQKTVDETLGIKKVLTSQQIANRYLIKSQVQSHAKDKLIDSIINMTINFPDKNTFQIYIADYDIITGDKADQSFLQKYSQLKEELRRKSQWMMYFQLKQKFFIVVTNKDRIYRVPYVQSSLSSKTLLYQQLSTLNNIRKVKSDNCNTLIFTETNRIYEWGYIEEQGETRKSLEAQKLNLQKQMIAQYYSKGENVLLSSQDGKVYVIKKDNSLIHSRRSYSSQDLKLLQLPDNIVIKQVCLSYYFTHFVAISGLLYSKGKNSRGELGLGFQSRMVHTLTLNTQLKRTKQHVDGVSVGMGHTVVRTRLGYAYAWGDNGYGQVGGTEQFYTKPRQINFGADKIKVYQVAAGLRATYLLTQNLAILGLGNSLGFSTILTNQPLQPSLLQQTNQRAKILNIIKIRCQWTQQKSVLYVNALDSSQCKQGSKPDAILKYSKSLAKQWTCGTIYPKYHQYMDNSLSLSDVRKLKFKASLAKQVKSQKPCLLQQVKLLISLRKSNPVFKLTVQNRVEEVLIELERKKDSWGQDEQQAYKTIMDDRR